MEATQARGDLIPRLRVCVEEQFDEAGDLVFTLRILATTHDRRMLDRIAESLGANLEFVRADRSAS